MPIAASARPRGWRGIALQAATLAWLLAVVAIAPVAGAATTPAQVQDMVDAGDFKAAEAAISEALADATLAPDARRAYAFQRERMRRILLDFTLDEAAVRERVRRQVPDLTDAEFAKWNREGLFEHMAIDGRTLYFNRSPSNLFRLSEEARARRDPKLAPITDGPMEALNVHQRAIRDAALAQHRSSVLPLRLRMTQSLTVDADAVPAGKLVRAWIPYPQAIPGHQEDVRFVASVPSAHWIAPESAPQRTVYMEKTAQRGQPTAFSVTYELTILGQYHAVDPDKVVAPEITAELAPYVAQRPPHVVFTDAMRAFSRKVVGDEKNPYRIAQKLFAAVDGIPWAGAREYSTISNISDYALHAGHADCGQQTLLLITLLRMNGIPARWQSGMVFSDGDYSNIHDWGQVYLAPYGWVPMDVTTGRLAADKGNGDDPAMEWFYFGGLDNWRIAFNQDWGTAFEPPKKQFRSDDVDNQRGEAEWDGGNLYFDQLDYDFQWQLLPAGQGSAQG
ncbi:MAG TPA: transglutaminase-like domain-containing protein [Luteimonas sp.]|nr:transglutaminase-like domain-containing protein [Luteimonas sp.]